jgi:hypothetical protein
MKVKPLNECEHTPMKFKLKTTDRKNKLKVDKPTAGYSDEDLIRVKATKRRGTNDDNSL